MPKLQILHLKYTTSICLSYSNKAEIIKKSRQQITLQVLLPWHPMTFKKCFKAMSQRYLQDKE